MWTGDNAKKDNGKGPVAVAVVDVVEAEVDVLQAVVDFRARLQMSSNNEKQKLISFMRDLDAASSSSISSSASDNVSSAELEAAKILRESKYVKRKVIKVKAKASVAIADTNAEVSSAPQDDAPLAEKQPDVNAAASEEVVSVEGDTAHPSIMTEPGVEEQKQEEDSNEKATKEDPQETIEVKEEVSSTNERAEESSKEGEETTNEAVEPTKAVEEPAEEVQAEAVEESTKDVEEPAEEVQAKAVEESTKDVEEPTKDVEESTKDAEESTKDAEESTKDAEEPTKEVEAPTKEPEDKSGEFMEDVYLSDEEVSGMEISEEEKEKKIKNQPDSVVPDDNGVSIKREIIANAVGQEEYSVNTVADAKASGGVVVVDELGDATPADAADNSDGIDTSDEDDEGNDDEALEDSAGLRQTYISFYMEEMEALWKERSSSLEMVLAIQRSLDLHTNNQAANVENGEVESSEKTQEGHDKFHREKELRERIDNVL
uniref:Uncharacterized protein n=1 Tax=Globisporangium ultimum (strain ATCC 200006 / CBS 805.95 / DAOM BR144) TaxID=431595 RepID=K3X2Y6_GLOUD